MVDISRHQRVPRNMDRPRYIHSRVDNTKVFKSAQCRHTFPHCNGHRNKSAWKSPAGCDTGPIRHEIIANNHSTVFPAILSYYIPYPQLLLLSPRRRLSNEVLGFSDIGTTDGITGRSGLYWWWKQALRTSGSLFM